MIKNYFLKLKNIIGLCSFALTIGFFLNPEKASATVYPPSISTVTPVSGVPGTTVTITGSYFGTTAASNVVYFGAEKAVVVTASPTSLTVLVPVGAILSEIQVVNMTSHRSCYSDLFFLPEYSNTCFVPNTFNFKPATSLSTGAATTQPYVAAIGDIDGDGKPDLVVANNGASSVSVYLNTSATGAVSYGSATVCSTAAGPSNIKLADLDGDGKLDIIVTCESAGTISLLRNMSTSGTASIASATNFTGFSGANETCIADFDGDGKPDIAIAASTADSVDVIRNVIASVPTGSFLTSSFSSYAAFAVGHIPVSLFTADFDNDGAPDIVTSNHGDGTISILHNTSGSSASTFAFDTGAITYSLAGGINPVEVQAADIDGDGFPDVIAAGSNASYTANALAVFYNNGAASTMIGFAAGVNFTAGLAPTGISTGDIDGDGKIDVVVANAGSGTSASTVSLFRNTSTSGTITTSSFSSAGTLATGIFPVGVAIGDLDGDNKPEIIIANRGSATLSIYRNYPLPVLDTITGALNLCIGTGTSFNDSTAGGTWSLSNATMATVSAAGVVTPISTGIDTIMYTLVCGGDTSKVWKSFTINAMPSVLSITGNSVVCIGVNDTLSDTTTGGAWSVSNSIATISAGIVSAHATGTDTVMYTITSAHCGNAIATKILTVNSLPSTGTITGPTSVCPSDSITLADTIAGSWAATNGKATVNATGLVHGITPGADTIKYSVTNTCGTSTRIYPITISSLPSAGVLSAATTVCAGSSTPFTSTVSGGVWSTTSTSIATVDSAGNVYGVSSGSATISYSVTNTCATAVVTKSISVLSLPVAGTISGPITFCTGVATALTDTVTGGTWMIPSSASGVASVDLTGHVTGISPGSTSVLYIQTNSCGMDTAFHNITVIAAPSAGVIGGITHVCISSSGFVSSTDTGGVWTTGTTSIGTINASTGLFVGLAAGSAVVTYTVTNSCGSAVAHDTITVNPFPTLSSSLTPAAVCSGTTFTYSCTSTSTGATFSWSRAAVTGISNAASSGSTSLISETLDNTTSATVAVVYTVTTVATGCSNVQDVTVQVTPSPTLSSGLNFTACSGVPFIYYAESNVAGTSMTWTRSTVTGITPAGPTYGTSHIDETLMNSTAAAIGVVYQFTLSANGCTVFENVNVNVEPAPPAAPHIALTSPSWLCASTLYQNFGASTTPPTGITYRWSATNATIWGTGNTEQYSLINFPNPGIALIYLTASTSGNTCGSKDSFEVFVGEVDAEYPLVTYSSGTFSAPGGMFSYQWGYDDLYTLAPTAVTGQTSASYELATPDFFTKYYWVETVYQFCTQKSYYHSPTGVINVNTGGVREIKVYPNPNNGLFTLNVASDYTETGTVTITNVVGETVKELTCNTNTDIELQLNEPSGIYLVTVITAHGKFTGKVMVSK